MLILVICISVTSEHCMNYDISARKSRLRFRDKNIQQCPEAQHNHLLKKLCMKNRKFFRLILDSQNHELSSRFAQTFIEQ